LVLDIFGVIFWLSAWASLAAWAAVGNIWTHYLDYSLRRRDEKSTEQLVAEANRIMNDSSAATTPSSTSTIYTKDYYKKYDTAWKCTAAAAAIGAVIWHVTSHPSSSSYQRSSISNSGEISRVQFIVCLVTYSIKLHRHRTDPANFKLPKDGSPLGSGRSQDAEIADGQQKHEENAPQMMQMQSVS
jgi:hypothetical protein